MVPPASLPPVGPTLCHHKSAIRSHSKLKSIARSPRHYYLLHKGQLKPRVTRPISVQQVLVMPLWHGPGAQLLSTTTTHAATTHGEDRTSDGAPHHLSRAQTRQRNQSVIISHKARICPGGQDHANSLRHRLAHSALIAESDGTPTGIGNDGVLSP